MRSHSGFTLIELMIVVAIIGILASVAIPAYQDYTKRANITEGLALAASAKTGITEFYNAKSYMPPNNQSAGLAMPVSVSGNAVTSLSISGGLVTVTFNAKVYAGGTLLISPTTGTGALLWTCKAGANLKASWLPSSCR